MEARWQHSWPWPDKADVISTFALTALDPQGNQQQTMAWVFTQAANARIAHRIVRRECFMISASNLHNSRSVSLGVQFECFG